jgi:hypothetical protein
MRVTKTHSYNIQIWVGLLENYEEDCITPSTKTKLHTIEEVEGICQRYVNKEKHCVTVTPTKFIYTGGNEPGAVIGLIQYPRFERHSQTLTNEAIAFLVESKVFEFEINYDLAEQPKEAIFALWLKGKRLA